jgi:hypothetical protein
MNTQDENQIFEEMARRWSAPVVVREQRTLDRFSGGLLNARTMANHDSAGTDPKGKIRVGRKVAYSKRSLIDWMIQRRYDLDQPCSQKRKR